MGEVQIIRSQRFSEYPSVVFGISTRIGGVSSDPSVLNLSFDGGDDRGRVADNRRRFLEALNVSSDQLAIPKQSHGRTVRRVTHPGEYGNCDALITEKKGVYLVLSVADCIPLFMYDPSKNVIAAVHVGWRGSALGIATETIRILKEGFHTAPEGLTVYLGPSARACCYEVGDDVARKFPPQFLQPKPSGKLLLDLTGVTKEELMQNGVREDRVEEDGHCTICTPELFHSYRRDGERSGRMMGLIGIVPEFPHIA
jgi:YfiH family protein